jgi:hypothetical protein
MARQKAIRPEVVEPDEKIPADLIALRGFARLMDEAVRIPLTNRRIGLDAGLGFIPGIGDVIGALLSSWIVIGALRHRVPLIQVIRMMANIIIDMVVGEIPILGDIFDIAFEENILNLRLLMRYRDRIRPPRSLARVALVAALVEVIIGGVALGLLAASVAIAIWLIGR